LPHLCPPLSGPEEENREKEELWKMDILNNPGIGGLVGVAAVCLLSIGIILNGLWQYWKFRRGLKKRMYPRG